MAKRAGCKKAVVAKVVAVEPRSNRRDYHGERQDRHCNCDDVES